MKELVLFCTAILFAVIGLLGLSNPYWADSDLSTVEADNNITRFDSLSNLSNNHNTENQYSDNFYKYEHLILNEEISKEKMVRKVKALTSDFEKDYLLGLLCKRKKDFAEAYDLLFKHLSSAPHIYRYYDELVLLGKITGNLDLISKWLDKKKEMSGYNHFYLKAKIEFEKGNSKKSVEEFNSLLNKGTKSNEIYYWLAYAYRSIGDYEKALQLLKESELNINEKDFFFAKVKNAEGALFYMSRDLESAEKLFNSAYNSARETGNVVEEIKAIANLAIIKDEHGDIEGAREDYKLAIRKSLKIENAELLAFLYSELGVSYTYTNNIVDARKNYEKSYDLYSILKNSERLSYLSSNIGSIFLQQANYNSALKYYNSGLRAAGENKLGQILNLTGIADVCSNESNYARALEYYNRAKEIADSIKDVSSIVKIDQGLGALFFNINRPAKSLQYLKDAEGKLSIDKMPYEAAELYYKMGVVLASIDSLEQAKKYLTDGVNLAENSGDIYNNIILNTELAYIVYESGETKKAKNILSLVQKLAKEYELIQVIALQDLYFGKIFEAEGNPNTAIKKYQNSFSLSGAAADFNTQIEAGYLLAQIFEQKQELKLAEEWYLRVTNIIEDISFPLVSNREIQISHFSGVNEIYNSLVEFYIKQGRDIEAFETIERSRSRNTMYNLTRLKIIPLFKDEEHYDQFVDLQWMIESGMYSSAEVDSLTKVSEKIRSSIIANNKELDRYLAGNSWKSLKEIQNGFDKNENLISIFVGVDYVKLFNLNADKLISQTVGIGRDSLISMIEKITPLYRDNHTDEEIYINQDLFSFNAEASYKLYDQIFREVFDNIPEEKNVIVSLPSELTFLPIELLVTKWEEGNSPYYYNDKSFLIEKYPVVYSPSASIYITQKTKQPAETGQNLLVGDPYITDEEFTLSYRSGLLEEEDYSVRNIKLFPLEYSKSEIKSVDNLISDNVVLLSEEATETNFKENASKSNLIHLSTHSFLFKNQPLIILSQQNDKLNDGFLELSEILLLNLKSDLVVLSSCRSGLGMVDEAEGIIGMQKAFMEAGAGSIVVSLWDVNDKYTSYFMKEFYNYLSNGLTKPEALRKAKISFMKKYFANPYYWSAFVISGNPSKINIQKISSFNMPIIFSVILVAGLMIFLLISKIKSTNHRQT